jgi:hypothetical protein
MMPMFSIYPILAVYGGGSHTTPFDKLPPDQQVSLIGGTLVGVIVFFLIRGRMSNKLADQTRQNLMAGIVIVAFIVSYEICRFIYFTFTR